MNHAILLSGGSGTRLWPLSRQDLPKQFLKLLAREPMLRRTLKIARHLAQKENIHIASNIAQRKQLEICLKGLGFPKANLFFEPEARSTFAPIGLLSRKIYEKDKHGVILVLPSDHYIRDTKTFLASLKEAVKAADMGFIVTVGIRPVRPETGYGYIKTYPKSRIKGTLAYAAEKFTEKPKIAKARQFLKNKQYFWNAGIFIFRADVMLSEIRRIRPHDAAVIAKIRGANLNRLWRKITRLSFDYAIMEKARNLALVPSDSGWHDMGSWEALEAIMEKDRYGNTFKGNALSISCRNTAVWADKRLVCAIGLKNTVVVDTKDAVLVCDKAHAQEVRKLVALLEKKGFRKQV